MEDPKRKCERFWTLPAEPRQCRIIPVTDAKDILEQASQSANLFMD
jgi:hypothetical protein